MRNRSPRSVPGTKRPCLKEVDDGEEGALAGRATVAPSGSECIGLPHVGQKRESADTSDEQEAQRMMRGAIVWQL